MSSTRYLVADVFDGLAALKAEGTQVDLVLSSPPFLCLRSYLPADHPDKAREIGSEPTPAAFLSTMLDVVEACADVLAPTGTLAFEFGDTYAGSGGAGGDYAAEGLRDGQERFDGSASRAYGTGARPRPARARTRTDVVTDWPLDKSMCMIPELFAASLAYGRNLLDPERTTDPWRIRNTIAWVRPNPPVGALCVDDQTEALTPDGWKRHDQLEDGDLIAAYDKGTDSVRFTPAKFVRWERENEPMVVVEKRKTSQRLTEDHRCLVRTTKRPEPHVVMAGDLTNSHQTMLTAPFDDVGGVEPMSDERAELLGWFVTEGSPKYRQALIRQSKTTNPDKVDRIRDLLVAEGADFHEHDYRRSSGPYGGDILTTFVIKGELAAWLNLHHKRLPEQYATTWPTTTLRALFRGLVDGDGHRRRDGGVLFFQKDRQVVDAFQIIAIRLGLRCSVTRQDRMDGWQATVGNPEHFESSRWTKVRRWEGEGIPRESYTGVVWCPMVETSFWLARRDGRTFITGNSDKFRPAKSLITVAAKARDRWFDLDAVRTPLAESTAERGEGSPRGNGKHMDDGTTNGAHGRHFTEQRSNPAGAPPLDWWKISPGGYSGKVSTTRRVRCGPDDGGERTTSPDCPVHADLPGQLPRALRDERAAAQSPRTPRTDDRHAQAQLDGFAPTDGTPDRSGSSPLPTTASSDPQCSPAATPRSTASSRTGPAPATTSPDTASGRSPRHTADTSASPQSGATHPDSPESRTSEACPTADGPGTESRTAHNPDQPSACSCSFYRTVTESTSHYAVWPAELLHRPIDAMCPRRVCRTCGTPSRRESSTEQVGTRNTNGRKHGGSGTLTENLKKRTEAVVTTTGWTTCGCPGTDGIRLDGYHTGTGWRPGIVLDPFGGSGTTGLVANGLGREAILLDLDERNADLARDRLGMFLTVEHLEREGAA